MKKTVKFLSVILAVIVVLTSFPLVSFGVSIVDSGSCGKGVTYTLDSDGLLTISGMGEMDDYSGGDSVWNSESIKKVVINSGVTSVGNYAFYNCTNLTDVTLPDGITSVGNLAFCGCSALEKITLPDSVVSLGRSAFYGCFALEKAVISSGITSVTDYSFFNCTGLENIIIPDSVQSIGDSAFYGCTGLTGITLPDSVESVANTAFNFCTGLETISVGKGNKVYKDSGNCIIETGSKTLILGCKNSVIPSDGSVTSVGNYAFRGCTGLENINIPDTVTSVGEFAFYECTGLKTLTVSKNVSDIGFFAFNNCSGLESISVGQGNNDYNGSGNCLVDTKSKTLILGCNNSIIPSDGSVTSVGDYAFYCCSGLKSINIPDTVTSVGDYAFYCCSGLTDLTIPEGVVSVGISAFECCSGIKSVNIPSSLTDIGDGAFNFCDLLKDVYYSGTEDDWKLINIGNFNDCLNNAEIHYDGDKNQCNGSHTWDNGTVTKQATCIEDGVKTFTCTVCKATKTEKIEFNRMMFNKENHAGGTEVLNAKAPTCGADGYTGDTYCNGCGVKLSDGTTIKATGKHTYGEWSVKTAPTYEKVGVQVRYCTVCKAEETGKIDKLVASESAKDENTGIQLDFADGIFESGVKLEVKTVPKDADVFKALSESKPNCNFEIFDISVTKDNAKVQPNGNVQITVPVPESFKDENVTVYYVKDNGETEKLQSYVKDGKIVFETNHFSYYAIVNEASVNLGDVNGDTKINTKDARAILRYVAKLEKFTPEQEKAADVNNDTKINTKDARKILRVVAKLETM